MSKRLLLIALPAVLLVAILAGTINIPRAHAGGFPSGPGTVCLVDSSSVSSLVPPGPCASGPYTFNGPFPSSLQPGPTQARISVYINGSAGFNAFDVVLASNSSVLQPAGFDLSGSVLPSPQVIVVCQGLTIVQGSQCGPADATNTFEVSAAAAPGQPLTLAPTTGLLFTAIYNIVGTAAAGGSSLGFQTGCIATSVAGGTCVTVADGSRTPVPETVQTGTLFNNSSCSNVCTIPWVAINSNVTSITVSQGATRGNAIHLLANARNGWPGLSPDSITFSVTAPSGFPSPTFVTVNPCSTGGTSCGVDIAVNTLTPGVYNVNIYATYVAFDSAGSGKTDTLVGTETVLVYVQSVSWTINGLSASSIQTLYMAQGASNPMTLFFAATSIGGYSGTVSIGTSVLSDAGTGLVFNYPASAAIAPGQTITQTITVTASSYGTSQALYRAQLSATGLPSQVSGALVIRVTGFNITTSSSSVSFGTGSSASVSIILKSLPSSTLGFAGTVTLTKSVVGGALTATCPSSLSLTAGGTTTGTCKFSGTTAGTFTVTITAIGGTNKDITNSTSLVVTVQAVAPGFQITANPTAVTSLVGTSPFSKITLKSVGGFSGNVHLSETSSPAVGLTCGFSATGIPLTTTASATVSCASPTANTYQVTVTGIGGSITNSTTITLTFTDFALFASPATVSTTPGVNATAAIILAPTNGFTGNVTLTESAAPPSGITCVLSATTITGGAGATNLTCSGAGGTYQVTVTGTSSGITRTASLTVNIADFSIGATPSSLTVDQGPPGGTITISVNSIGGFSGTATLSASSPSGISAKFSTSSITMSGSSILTISVSPPFTSGIYLINVTGTSGSLSHSVTISVTVTPVVTTQPPIFTQMTWHHRFSLSKYGGIQTWRFGVENNSTSTIYFSVTITGLDNSGLSSFTQSTGVFSEIAGQNLSNIALSQSFDPTQNGETFLFTAVINWGTTATTDPSQLPFTSTQTNGQPTSGTFTVLA